MNRTVRLLLPFAVGAIVAGCSAKVEGPAPALEGITPQAVCTEQHLTKVAIAGSGLSPMATKVLTDKPQLVLPKLTVSRVKDLGGADVSGEDNDITDDPSDPGASNVRWLSQTAMEFDVTPERQFATGLYSLKVTNGNAKAASLDGALLMVPAPVVTKVDPEVVCLDEAQATTITGDFFISGAAAMPKVGFRAPGKDPIVLAPKKLDDCRDLPGSLGLKACKSITVELPKGALAKGNFAVEVENPEPVNCDSHGGVPGTANQLALTVVDDPKLATIAPALVCTEQGPTPLVLTGADFLTYGGAAPGVTIGALALTATAASCEAVPLEGLFSPRRAELQRCTTLNTTFQKNALTPGTYPVKVKNPAPAACESQENVSFEVVPPPTITSVAPTKVCAGGPTFQLTGTGFRTGAVVTVGTTESTSVTVDAASAGTKASATMPAGLPVSVNNQKYDVSIKNSEGCSATLAQAIEVVPGPAVFFADPSVVYNGVTTQATFYGTGFTGAVSALSFRLSGSAAAPTTMVFTYDSNNPNRVLGTIPKGLAAGDYDVILSDQTSCPATLAKAFTVVSATTLTINTVTPSFGTQGQATAVGIKADATAGGGLQNVPRVYLNPSTPTASTIATPLTSVAFLDAGTLTAIIPANTNLTAGSYDLIVVNPKTGTATPAVGVKTNAFTIVPTNAPPPVVTGLSPGAITTQLPPTTTTPSFSITGTNFRTPTVRLTCTPVANPAATPTVSNPTVLAASSTATQVDVYWGSPLADNVCIVRVTNGDNNTFFDFSALAITNPAQKLSVFTQSTHKLGEARRALSAISGRVTPVARYLYVIGGDDGTEANPKSSVESAALDPLGDPGTFSAQVNPLSEKRSYLATARLGRFIYAVGGFGGSTATPAPLTSIERAYVLDPAFRPAIDDLSLDVSTTGLDGGVYSYRVAAVMASGDVYNPGGETLASDSFGLSLPTLDAGKKIKVTVKWTAPKLGGTASTSVAQYIVYRTAKGAAAGAEKELGRVSGTTLEIVDDGTATLGTKVPLPIGSLGVWKKVADLATARVGAGAAIAVDPTLANKAYLYVIGGKPTAPTVTTTPALKTYEIVPLTLGANGAQTVGTVTPGTLPLSTGRWQLGAVAVDASNASNVTGGKTFIYAGSGISATGASVTDFDAAEVSSGGQLTASTTTAWDAVTKPTGRSGYGLVAANNFLYLFGGTGSAPDNKAVGADVTTAPPVLGNFSNLTATYPMQQSRYLLGATVESAFMYLVGGQSTASAATDTVEYTIY